MADSLGIPEAPCPSRCLCVRENEAIACGSTMPADNAEGSAHEQWGRFVDEDVLAMVARSGSGGRGEEKEENGEKLAWELRHSGILVPEEKGMKHKQQRRARDDAELDHREVLLQLLEIKISSQPVCAGLFGSDSPVPWV